MMWLLPGSDARAFVLVMITYLVGLAGLSHLVAGSSEAFYALWDGTRAVGDRLARFLVPVAIGNMAGGIALVAALCHAQVAADARR